MPPPFKCDSCGLSYSEKRFHRHYHGQEQNFCSVGCEQDYFDHFQKSHTSKQESTVVSTTMAWNGVGGGGCC